MYGDNFKQAYHYKIIYRENLVGANQTTGNIISEIQESGSKMVENINQNF